MASVVVSPLQKLLSGEPLPTAPAPRRDWNAERVQIEYNRFNIQLLDYIRRLVASLTAENLVIEIDSGGGTDVTIATGWRYDATTHKFQQKTKSIKVISVQPESGWTDITDGTQPTNVTDMVDWRYNSPTHQFEYKTRSQFVLEAGSVSGFSAVGGDQPSSVSVMGDWKYDTTTHKFQENVRTIYALEPGSLAGFANTTGGQPVSVTSVIDVHYDTTAHILYQDVFSAQFVLEAGTETDDEHVDDLVSCGS